MRGTALDALMAELLGDVGKLHDQVTRLNSQLPTTLKSFEAMNDKLLADRNLIAKSISALGEAPPQTKGISERVLAAAIIITCVTFLFTLALGMFLGNSIASDKAKAEIAWLSSVDGKEAKRLAHENSIELLSKCTGNGWRLEEQTGDIYCMPYSFEKDGKQYVTGWKIGGK